MKPNLLVRTLTLAAFILLMSGFVAYKAGAFEGYLNDHASTADTPGKDSVKPVPRMAPGSKAPVLIEHGQPAKKDTSKKPPQQQSNQRDQAPNQSNSAPPKENANQSNQNNAPKPDVYMGSSKSAPVFTQQRDTSTPK